MEHALRLVERIAEEQRDRILELQDGHLQLEKALSYIRIAHEQQKESISQRSAPKSDDREERPRSSSQPQHRTPSRTPPRTPPWGEDASAASARRSDDSLPRTSKQDTGARTEVGGAAAAEEGRSRMTRNSSRARPFQKAEDTQWPEYPHWQDLPLRRFGDGYGRKRFPTKGNDHIDAGQVQEEQDDLTEGRDVAGQIRRNAGRGRKPVEGHSANQSKLGGWTAEAGQQGHPKDMDLVGGLEWGIGHGKKKIIPVKDHLHNMNNWDGSSSSSAVSRPDLYSNSPSAAGVAGASVRKPRLSGP